MSDLYLLLCLFFSTFQVKHLLLIQSAYANNFVNLSKTKNQFGSLKSQPQDSFEDPNQKKFVFPIQFLVQYRGLCDFQKICIKTELPCHLISLNHVLVIPDQISGLKKQKEKQTYLSKWSFSSVSVGFCYFCLFCFVFNKVLPTLKQQR